MSDKLNFYEWLSNEQGECKDSNETANCILNCDTANSNPQKTFTQEQVVRLLEMII